jgi:hypothetical protein
MKARYLLFLLLFTGSFCMAQGSKDTIVVLPIKMQLPAGAQKLGSIKVGNNTTKTTCDYEADVLEAKEKARAMHGNLVKITQLAEPSFIGKCYRIVADVYHVHELPDYHTHKAPVVDTNTGRPYALLCIYRLTDTITFGTPYSVHLDNDSVICTTKSRSHDSVKIYKDGPIRLWAKTERVRELDLTVKTGEVYYIRCGLKKGEIRMIPHMALADDATGKREFEKLSTGKKDLDVSYLQQPH